MGGSWGAKFGSFTPFGLHYEQGLPDPGVPIGSRTRWLPGHRYTLRVTFVVSTDQEGNPTSRQMTFSLPALGPARGLKSARCSMTLVIEVESPPPDDALVVACVFRDFYESRSDVGSYVPYDGLVVPFE